MIPYDLTKIRAVIYDIDGVLSPSTIPLGADGIPRRMVNIKDGYAMQLAAKKGLLQAIVTGGDTESIRVRYNALGITDVYLKAADKLPIVERWMAAHGLRPDEVAYAGDDIPDIPVMRRVGLAVAPADAARDVKETACYISPVEGGYGVARDILEQVLRAKGLWMTHADAFGW